MRTPTVNNVGKTQSLVLEYLAKHPDQLIQPLSKELKKDYSNVNKAVNKLYEKGYLTRRPGKSEKGGEYQVYRLSEKGICYVLATDKADINKIINKYREATDSKLIHFYRKIGTKLNDKELLKKLAKHGGQIFLLSNNKSDADMILSMSTALTMATVQFTEKDRAKLKKAFSKNRKLMRDFQRVFKNMGFPFD